MKKLNCPKCEGSVELNRIYSEFADVDQCPKCEGMWFDHVAGELTAILSAGRDKIPEALKVSLEANAGRMGLSTRKSQVYKCPSCGGALRRYWYASEVGKSFEVDGCSAGCGVWLDDGELGKAFDFLNKADLQLKDYYRRQGIIGKVNLLMQDQKKKGLL